MSVRLQGLIPYTVGAGVACLIGYIGSKFISPKKKVKNNTTDSKLVKVYQSNNLDFSYVKARASNLPSDLTVFQYGQVEKACLNDYNKSMEVLEDSIADAAANNPQVKQLIDVAAKRLLTVIEKYAQVIAEPGKAEMEVYRVLANLYLEGSQQSRDYPGNVGSNPLALMKVLKEGNMREQLFLLGEAQKSLLRTILATPDTVNAINVKLAGDGIEWRLEHNSQFHLLGCYAARTGTDKLRTLVKDPKKAAQIWKDNNPTVLMQEVSGRMPASVREQRYTLSNFKFTLTELEKRKKLGWGAGAAVLIPTTIKDNPKLSYLEGAENLHLKLIAGISASVDQILSTIHALGLNTRKDLLLARAACLFSFIDGNSHSAHEVMYAGKSFGLDYTPAPDFYKQIDPDNTFGFLQDVTEKQRKRGYCMPDNYLQGNYPFEKARQLALV